LRQRNVRYLLAGGLAMNLHGVPRTTMDVDLVLALDEANLDLFIECARDLGLRPQAPVPLESLRDADARRTWIEQKNLIAFALGGAPGTPTVDVLLKHALDFDQAFDRALVQQVENVPVRIASLDDMISLKRNTGRRQDEDDIAHLLRMKGEQP
jgi:predicted nucleotidyltransferase